MSRKIRYIFLSLCMIMGAIDAQVDTIQHLPEVVISDVKLKDFSQGLQLRTIKDSVLHRSKTSLTEVLRYHSPIFLRENGPGGVSSPSFRGTSAQQTAVVWNGIAINSQLNGQTDFNTISSRNYSNLSVRSGGGSILYGSGAIGGSVHLNSDIRFAEAFENNISLGYGSYDTPSGNFKSIYSTNRFYVDVAVDYIKSENDFEYLNTNQSNTNGQFENKNLNLNLGFTLARNQLLKVYHNSFLGDRNFSGTLTAPSTAAYEDRNTRTLTEWAVLGNRYDSKLRFAHVFEQFRFFTDGENKESYSFGKAIRYTANYDFVYRFGKNKKLKAVIDYTSVDGSGTSISSSRRNTFAAVGLWQHQLTRDFDYGLQLRQEATSNFDSPLLIGLNAGYAFAKAYKLTLNASRNFRVPTFNDLFWQGAGAAGNPDLQAETSWQAEIGHHLNYENGQLTVTSFIIRSANTIQWRPNASGIWSPINVEDTQNYGLEITAGLQYPLGKGQANFSGNYAFTKTENMGSGKQLLYVPRHKVTGGVGYQWKWLSAQYHFLYNDAVFTTTDNKGRLAGYAVSNVGIECQLAEKQTYKLSVSLQARNIYNKNYQTIAFRPNPGRNFLIQTTYTF